MFFKGTFVLKRAHITVTSAQAAVKRIPSAISHILTPTTFKFVNKSKYNRFNCGPTL